jgi:holo-[acyl-carrier protein] synthase
MEHKMSIIGIGTDIIAIDRFAKTVAKHHQKFLDKIFTRKEQDYCNKHSDPIPFFAARFSAKEAISKALGCGLGEKLTFLDMEIVKDASGKPHVILSKTAQERFNHPKIHLSLSHCKQYATATAIAL